MDLRLRGKRVLITGASKGIGAAGAEVFAEEGCDVVIAARNGTALDELAQRLRSSNQVNVTPHVVDLRDGAALARLAETAWPFDILINNAGDIPQGTIETIDEKKWRHAWELKVFGYINLTRAIYAQMKVRGHGVIVNDIGAAADIIGVEFFTGSTDVVDDDAMAARLHLRIDDAGEIDVAEHFQLPGVSPCRFVDLVDRAAGNVAGIVDEDVDVGGIFCQFGNILWLAQVDDVRRGIDLMR